MRPFISAGFRFDSWTVKSVTEVAQNSLLLRAIDIRKLSNLGLSIKDVHNQRG